MSSQAYLGLGTNLGDRLANLDHARRGLSSAARLLRASSIYETAPWGFTDQPAFLNQVLEVQTDLFPLDLLNAVKDLEFVLGRQPTFLYGPRQIDIDILLYANICLDLPGLVIPHPHLAERAFVLAPLAELVPELVHPVHRQTIQALLNQVDCAGVKLYPQPAA